MTGKELIFQTLRHEPTPRAPWVPFAGVHAGVLVGATATQVLTDEETLVRALLEVNRLYKRYWAAGWCGPTTARPPFLRILWPTR